MGRQTPFTKILTLVMEDLEQEIVEFHLKQDEMSKLETELSKIESDIIDKYCPFKNGDKVIFTEWWRNNGKDYFGVIKNIFFKGINEKAIDNRWVICVESTTKDFSRSLGGSNTAWKYLGEHKKDTIRKA